MPKNEPTKAKISSSTAYGKKVPPKVKFQAQDQEEECVAVNLEEVVSVKKSEFMSLVLSRLSSYFMIIGSNGEARISSGEPPSIVIDSERRAGNKV